LIRVFTNKNKEIRSGFKIAIFTIIYLILSGTVGQLFLSIVYGFASRNNLIQGENFTKRIEKYLYSTDVGVFSLQLIGFITMLLTVFILLRGLESKRFKDIGLISIKEDVKGLGWGLLLGAGSMAVIFIFLLASGNITLKESLRSPNFTTSVLWGIALYIVVSLNEEIMCRGYIQTTLDQMGKPWLSAIITSATFSALHLGNPNVKTMGLVNIFLVGLLFSYMYIRTKSLWMPIGYHFTWNYFQGNVFGFPVSGTTQSKGIYNIEAVNENILTGGSFGPEAGILATVVIIIGAVVVWRATRHKNFMA
jgi:membrane protease YdiL (CAAX protease family)